MKFAKTIICTLFAVALTSSTIAGVKISDISSKGKVVVAKEGSFRSSPYKMGKMSKELKGLQAVFVKRGTVGKPGVEFSFKVDVPVTVYLLVDARGKGLKLKDWKKTDLKATWVGGGKIFKDIVYKKDFPAGVVKIMGNPKDKIPNCALVKKK